MALTAHLAELLEKHRLLERKIDIIRAHSSVDMLEIADLKREKLKLKDQITLLRGELAKLEA